MLGTILLAVDGSPHAERAAELVRQLAKEGGNKVVVLHVIEVMPLRGGGTVDLYQNRDGVEAAGRYGTQLELAGVPTKVELIHTLAGHVARLIVVAARDHEAGMIVLGSRGRNDLSALLLGSVAHKVIHLADRPVLVVR
jgi:nucleotide-binding universal stress UspA family protein